MHHIRKKKYLKNTVVYTMTRSLMIRFNGARWQNQTGLCVKKSSRTGNDNGSFLVRWKPNSIFLSVERSFERFLKIVFHYSYYITRPTTRGNSKLKKKNLYFTLKMILKSVISTVDVEIRYRSFTFLMFFFLSIES